MLKKGVWGNIWVWMCVSGDIFMYFIYIEYLYKFYYLYRSVPNSKILMAHPSAQRQDSHFSPKIHFAVICVTFPFSLLISSTSGSIRGLWSVTAAAFVAREGTNWLMLGNQSNAEPWHRQYLLYICHWRHFTANQCLQKAGWNNRGLFYLIPPIDWGLHWQSSLAM